MPGPSRHIVLLSDDDSTITSAWHLMLDYDRAVVSVSSAATGSFTVTVQGSLDDGLTSSINTLSTLTTIVAPGIFTVDPGVRWIRAARSSVVTIDSVQLQLSGT